MRVLVRALTLCLLASLAGPAVASAQEAGSFGISAGQPTALGFAWQITDRIAVRPGVDLDSSRSESTTTLRFGGQVISSTAVAKRRSLGLGVSGLFTIYRQDNLSLYLTPQYLRTSTKVEYSLTNPFGTPENQDGTDYLNTVSGRLGMRYRLGERFGVYGEVGVNHGWQGDRERSLPSDEARDYSFTDLASGVGIVFWF